MSLAALRSLLPSGKPSFDKKAVSGKLNETKNALQDYRKLLLDNVLGCVIYETPKLSELLTLLTEHMNSLSQEVRFAHSRFSR